MPPTCHPAGLLMVCVLLAVASGCHSGRPVRLVAPAFSAEEAAAAIFARTDANGDGSIDAEEAARLPALRQAVGDLDADGDQRLSRGELLGWLEEIRQSRVAVSPLGLTINHRGKPLAGVQVRLAPEDLLGPGVQPATGTTDAAGLVRPAMAGSQHAGVNCGLYRIEFTGRGNDGRPLAARFNTASTLGLAVGGQLPRSGVVTFSLD